MKKFHDNHILFSVENALHPAKYKELPTHEEVLDFLRSHGEDAVSVDGHYGSPERSILINNPKNAHGIHQLAEDLGQDSILHSNAGNHTLHYLNGPQKGKQVKGKGTVFHNTKPADMYTSIKGPDGVESYFTHNLDFEKSEDLAKMPKTFSGTAKKPYTTIYRMQNKQGEGPYGGDHGVDSLDSHGGPNTPAPAHDNGFNQKDLAVLSSNPSVAFGFNSKEEANGWFTPEEQAALKESGWELQPVKAKNVWSSGKQAFFERYKKPKKL